VSCADEFDSRGLSSVELTIHAARANKTMRNQSGPGEAMNQRWRPDSVSGVVEAAVTAIATSTSSSVPGHCASHQLSISDRNAKTTLRLSRCKRWMGSPPSRSQRCTVRTPRRTYAAISFQESSRSSAGSTGLCAAPVRNRSVECLFIISRCGAPVFAAP